MTVPAHDWGAAPELFGPRHRYREALMLRRFLPAVPGPEVLNAGAGAGSLSLAAAAAGLRVTSVDASPELCAWTRAALARQEGPGARAHPVAVGDLRRLDLPDAAFDGALCGEVLEHLDDDAAGARELARVLRPGGVLVASVPAGPFRYDWTDHWAGHRRRYTAGGLERLLAGAGLGRVRVVAWGFPLTGLYHRWAYRPALRRRLVRGERPGDSRPPPAASRPAPRALDRVVRAALELDTAFLGRRPGYLGLLAVAWR